MTINLNETYFSEKKLQFGDIWLRNLKKIVQIEVFGHFLNISSLVFLDFAHSDRWAWCLVIFLQFAGPVNVFLLCFTFCITQRSYEKIMCIYLLFDWFEWWKLSYFYIFFTQRTTGFGRLKRNMNDVTMVFLMSLLIALTWYILLLFFFLTKDHFMFWIKSLFFSFNFS